MGSTARTSLLLSADVYTALAEATTTATRSADTSTVLGTARRCGRPPSTGLLLSRRGGDYELHLGQDLSIGYDSHDADQVQLYLQESLTFLALTAEASVTLPTA